MNLNFDKIWAAANARYAAAKLEKAGYDNTSIMYMAPEMIPQIASDQVKCMLEALIEEINHQTPKRLG